MNYENICRQVAQLARNVGKELMEYREKNALVVEAKGHNDFVTQMDKFSEAKLVEGLSKIVPEAGFIAEESTRTDKGEHFNWIVDPIDGTTNFIHKLPPFAISIGLMEDDKMVVGVVYELCGDELFTAWENGGAYLNGLKINISKADTVEDALVSTGFPYNNFDRIEEYTTALLYFMRTSHGVRRHGSAATDLAYVACGRFDAFFEYDLKPYDVAAGVMLIKEAGGKISDFSNGSDFIFGREIVATNGLVHDKFMEVILKSFGK